MVFQAIKQEEATVEEEEGLFETTQDPLAKSVENMGTQLQFVTIGTMKDTWDSHPQMNTLSLMTE